MASLNVKCSNDRLLLKFEGKAERNDVDLFQALFMKTTEKTFLKSHTHTRTEKHYLCTRVNVSQSDGLSLSPTPLTPLLVLVFLTFLVTQELKLRQWPTTTAWMCEAPL